MSDFSDVRRFGNTDVEIDGANRKVVLYDTKVFDLEDGALTLRHGGHKTDTTKRRINESLDAAGFDDWNLYQDDFTWYVVTPQGTAQWDCEAIRFPLDGKEVRTVNGAPVIGQGNHL